CAAVRFARRLTAGAFLTYLVVLAMGPLPDSTYIWATLVFTWYTMLLLPLVASPRALEQWRGWTRKHIGRRSSWLVYAPMLILIGAESALHVDRLARDAHWY